MRVTVLNQPKFNKNEFFLFSTEELFNHTGNNTGNLVHAAAVFDHIATEFSVQPWHAPAEILRETSDLLVIICANQLYDKNDLTVPARFLEEANLPVVAIGLGAQGADFDSSIKLSEGTDRWIRCIADHSPNGKPNIGLRGEYSYDILSKLGLGKAGQVTGCPSFFISPEKELGKSLLNKNISVTPRVLWMTGMPDWEHLMPLERRIVELVTQLNGKMVVQSDLSFVQTTRGEFETIDPPLLARIANYYCPNLELKDFKKWCKDHTVSFFDLESWIAMIKSHDCSIGPRIHGAMLSLQMGVPAVCIAHDSRTLEICQLMKVPYLWYTDVKDPLNDSLKILSEFDAGGFDSNRLKLAGNYANFLENLGLKPTGALSQLLK